MSQQPSHIKQTGVKFKGKVENVTMSVMQSAWQEGTINQDAVVLSESSVCSKVEVKQLAVGGVVTQKGVVSSGLNINSKAEVKQLAIGGVGTQKGVVSSGLNINSKAEVKQLAIGGVVSQDHVSQ